MGPSSPTDPGAPSELEPRWSLSHWGLPIAIGLGLATLGYFPARSNSYALEPFQHFGAVLTYGFTSLLFWRALTPKLRGSPSGRILALAIGLGLGVPAFLGAEVIPLLLILAGAFAVVARGVLNTPRWWSFMDWGLPLGYGFAVGLPMFVASCVHGPASDLYQYAFVFFAMTCYFAALGKGQMMLSKALYPTVPWLPVPLLALGAVAELGIALTFL
ncbi:MAG: hypothetical protein M1358_14485 [Chloroflexi bacterium]|nr:hypothetical protein [Chloroflexota bacterium]